MIFPSNRVRIFVAAKPIDFRNGHNGLATIVRNALRKDPFTGAVFIFRSKRADRVKILFWDGSGLVDASEKSGMGLLCVRYGRRGRSMRGLRPSRQGRSSRSERCGSRFDVGFGAKRTHCARPTSTSGACCRP
jgi:IS66 Orf2 like protein